MMRLFRSIALISAMYASTSAWSIDCNGTDRQNMKTGGMAEDRIAALCGDGVKPAPTKAWPTSNVCQTNESRCTLSVRGKLGESCWCTSSMGVQQGVLSR